MPRRGRTPMGPAQTLLGLQPAPRSLVRSPGAAKRPVSIVYRVEAVLEYCLGRGHVPERFTKFTTPFAQADFPVVETES